MDSFRKEVYSGLGCKPKRLPSRYFYDDTGDQIFRSIMDVPEYYLPESEKEIINNYSSEIAEQLIQLNSSFEIVELGAGDGSKTLLLLTEFQSSGLDIVYRPLDISQHILDANYEHIISHLAGLSIKPVEGNFFETLKNLNRQKERRLTLFLGSNIGNFQPDKALEFLKFVHANSEKGDVFLIAFDLKKDPDIILQAYNDERGITAAFNLNLLRRINRELGANFDLNSFKHFPTYDPISGVASSYIVSKKAQKVNFPDNISFYFEAHEPIHTEVSIKYSKEQVIRLADSASLRLRKWWTDSKEYYALALFGR